jgi:hypothetical protein
MPEYIMTHSCRKSYGRRRHLQGVLQALHLRLVRVGHDGTRQQVNGMLAALNGMARANHSSESIAHICRRIAKVEQRQGSAILIDISQDTAKVFTNQEIR